MKIVKKLGVFLGFAMAGAASHADPVISLGDSVSGAYYNAGTEVFPANNLTNNRFDDTGSPSDWSFWLAPDGQNGQAIIDLTKNFTITGFNLQDTHNRGYSDRGTQDFNIEVSQDGVHFTPVLTSSFSQTEWSSLTVKGYSVAPVVGRYVEVNVLSLWGGASGGLNELDVLGHAASVPDVSSTAGLFALALAGLGAFHKLRRPATA